MPSSHTEKTEVRHFDRNDTGKKVILSHKAETWEVEKQGSFPVGLRGELRFPLSPWGSLIAYICPWIQFLAAVSV